VRRVIVSEFVSLDGVMQAPGDAGEYERGGWSFRADRGPEGDQYKFDELAAAGSLLLGRVTYEGFASAWPQMEEQTGEYGAWMNGYPKHVVSTTLQEPLEWNNSSLIEGDIAEEVTKLKDEPGKDILVFGSGDLVNALMRHDLVDEYRLMIFPVIVGNGKRLFNEDSEPKSLRLTGTTTFDSGAVVLAYEPAEE
jgi:dihydrofolate reductase